MGREGIMRKDETNFAIGCLCACADGLVAHNFGPLWSNFGRLANNPALR